MKINERDTVKVLSILLNDSALIAHLTPLYNTQTLKIVRNIYLKKDYKFLVNNKMVEYTNIDSTDNRWIKSNWKKPLYYLTIIKIKLSNDNQFYGIFKFRSIGINAEFIIKKKINTWEITKLDISQF